MILRLDLCNNLLTGKLVGVWPYGFLNESYGEIILKSRENQLITSSFFFNLLNKLSESGCCDKIKLDGCSATTYKEWLRALRGFREYL